MPPSPAVTRADRPLATEPRAWHAMPSEAVLAALEAAPHGLSEAEAERACARGLDDGPFAESRYRSRHRRASKAGTRRRARAGCAIRFSACTDRDMGAPARCGPL